MRFRQGRFLLSVCVTCALFLFYTFNGENTSKAKRCVGECNRDPVRHVSAVEYFGLQLRSNVEPKGELCVTPDLVQNGWPWPECVEKVDWLTKHWEMDTCYAEEGVNGSVCSVLEYLTNKERYCPQTEEYDVTISSGVKLKYPRTDFTDLIRCLSENADLSWMVNRISLMQRMWVQRARELHGKRPFPLSKKRIHVHLGLIDVGMGRDSRNGGAMGELLQWSDVIASLYVLGHSLDITSTKTELIGTYSKYIIAASKSQCAGQSVSSFKYDLVYTDITGFKILSELLPKFENLKCRMRILDSFGTEAAFNIRDADESNPFGGLKLLLPQFNTMFPHSPDNTFMGFVVEPLREVEDTEPSRGDVVLVYGKDGSFWNGTRRYLDLIHEYFGEIHATVSGDLTYIPEYVINHGILAMDDLHAILKATRIFVGLGFPFEGPAPLEAIAHGAVFLNPAFDEPVSADNHQFFRDKPTRRGLRFQNPYVQNFIGEPYSYAVNMKDQDNITRILKRIIRNDKSQNYLPFEFSVKGMLERVSTLVEMQNFCYSGSVGNNHNQLWPPKEALVIASGRDSCTRICERLNLICEPRFFSLVNTKSAFEKAGMSCDFEHYPNRPQMGYPAYVKRDKACCIQTHYHYFSCSHEIPDAIRLCPCRDYQRGQIALCKSCSPYFVLAE